jgi:membrane protein YdbS with pleckstrin-like domain
MKAPILALLRTPPAPQPPAGAPGTLLVFRAAPGFFLHRCLAWGLKQAFTLIGVGVVLFFMWQGAREAEPGLGRVFFWLEILAVAFVLLGMPFSLMVLRLDYEMRWYQVTDRSLRIREGVWAVREMTMTFANVQNIEVSQGPLQRLFGIADLKVQTAGGGGSVTSGKQGQEGPGFNMHLGYFRGVENAGQVRDMMLERLKRYRDAGLGDHDHSHEPVAAAPASPSPALADVVGRLGEEAAGLRRAAEALGAG